MKTIVPLTPEKVAYATKRLTRLNAKLVGLERSEIGQMSRDQLGKAIRSTRTAIKRWEDILAGRAVH